MNNEAIRKAAVLVASLDASAADRLLDRLPPEQAARVRSAVMDLGELDPAEQRAVLAEFAKAGGDARPATYDQAAEIASIPSLRPDETATYQPPEPRKPFQFLHDADAESLVPELMKEHPQTIAVVVSHLPTLRAAEVLARLPAHIQTSVVERLVDLDAADPEVVKEIEAQLESVLAEQVRARSRRAAGLSAVQNILRAANPYDRLELLGNISRSSSQLLTRLNEFELADEHDDEIPSAPNVIPISQGRVARPRMVSSSATVHPPAAPEAPTVHHRDPQPGATSPIPFSELANLSDSELALVLKSAGQEVSLLALAAANRELLARLLRPLPPHEARAFRKRLEQIAPVRLREVEEAQSRLMEVASEVVAKRRTSPLRGAPRAAA